MDTQGLIIAGLLSLCIVLALFLCAALMDMRGSDGATRIARARRRQLQQGCWLPDWADAAVRNDQLVLAAVCYALPEKRRDVGLWGIANLPSLWPWERHEWQPGSRIADLTEAGALIAAELDRQLLLEARQREADATFNNPFRPV